MARRTAVRGGATQCDATASLRCTYLAFGVVARYRTVEREHNGRTPAQPPQPGKGVSEEGRGGLVVGCRHHNRCDRFQQRAEPLELRRGPPVGGEYLDVVEPDELGADGRGKGHVVEDVLAVAYGAFPLVVTGAGGVRGRRFTEVGLSELRRRAGGRREQRRRATHLGPRAVLRLVRVHGQGAVVMATAGVLALGGASVRDIPLLQPPVLHGMADATCSLLAAAGLEIVERGDVSVVPVWGRVRGGPGERAGTGGMTWHCWARRNAQRVQGRERQERRLRSGSSHRRATTSTRVGPGQAAVERLQHRRPRRLLRVAAMLARALGGEHQLRGVNARHAVDHSQGRPERHQRHRRPSEGARVDVWPQRDPPRVGQLAGRQHEREAPRPRGRVPLRAEQLREAWRLRLAAGARRSPRTLPYLLAAGARRRPWKGGGRPQRACHFDAPVLRRVHEKRRAR